jgi:hypothetical protein
VATAEEYRADFGKALKPPPLVTTFRYKASGKPKAKKAAKQPAAKPAAQAAPSAPAADSKTKRIQRQLETARKKLEDAKAAGKTTRPLEDRVYEIEDALRLATAATH